MSSLTKVRVSASKVNTYAARRARRRPNPLASLFHETAEEESTRAKADKGVTLVSLATTSKDLRGQKLRPTVAGATVFGEAFGVKAKAAGLNVVVFDRAGRRYHGTVKSFAEAARKSGLSF
ncbi:MAG: hypothetical protein EBU04_01410 [Verrucomicrobia bacterium]|nr:hypothetical protein [Verrucomicrobiota bacterium]